MTAACNYACTYCVPDGKKLQPASAELDAAQLLQCVKLLVEGAGIDRLRITGGEPLLSKKLDQFLLGVAELPLQDVGMTTNGQLLPRYFDLIAQSGIRRLNISLDTLDSSNFRSIARSGDLETVLAGIELALGAGMKVKINTVPMRRANRDQLLPLLNFALDKGIELRYIELMNMGHLKYNNEYEKDFIGLDEILELISAEHTFEKTDAPRDSTAIRYTIPGKGNFGIIANESEPFCTTCTRLRISSNGRLFGCLSNTRSYDLRPLLDEAWDIALAHLQPILMNALADKQKVAFTGETTVMKFIGG